MSKLLIGPILSGVSRRALTFGPYGSGKSFAVRFICGELSAAGRPVFRVDAPSLDVFLKVWAMASEREGAVVVVEDVETLGDDVSESGLRALFNVIDGGDKSAGRPSLLCTTNHPERVPLPLLRPGRFDDVLFVGLPAPRELGILLGTNDAAIVDAAHGLGLSAAEAVEVRKRAGWLDGDYGAALASYEDYRRLVRVRLGQGLTADCLGGLHALLQSIAADDQQADADADADGRKVEVSRG